MGKQVEIVTYRDTEIYCPVYNGQPYVAIKPICEALGIDRKAQQRKIREHAILNKVAESLPTTGKDGKEYVMYCLPYRYVFGWLFNIDISSIKEEARSTVLLYQEECYEILFDHFVGRSDRYKKRDALIMQLQDEIDTHEDMKRANAKAIKEKKDRIRELLSTPVNQLDMFVGTIDSIEEL